MKEIDIWEVEERTAGRLQSGTATFKTDAREDEHHEECCEDDANGRVGLPLLK
jgi:hypothetical protein